MFLIVSSLLLQAPLDYLVVDGIVVGALGKEGWTVSKRLPDALTIEASEVGVAVSRPLADSFRLENSGSGPWISASDGREGVFFTGKAWTPREANADLDRSQVLAKVSQFAKNRGVDRPQPYLLNVWQVDLDGDGTKEQIIEAVSNPRQTVGPSWECVLLRWRQGKEERIYPLSFSFPSSGEPTAKCRLRAIADFDGDGPMELVTTAWQDSLFTATIWHFRDGKLLPAVDTTAEISR